MEDGSENVSFVFETRYITQQQSDERLAVCGSLQVLGNWSITTAVIAEEIPPKSGRWVAAAELPQNSTFEWKWVVMAEDRSKAYRWEERPNRSLSIGKCPTHVRSVWNLGEESTIPLKHKFKQKGTVTSDSEDEEEWSYLPSPELLQLLNKGNTAGSEEHNSSTERQKQINNLQLLNEENTDGSEEHNYVTEGQKQINNLNCCKSAKTESYEDILKPSKIIENVPNDNYVNLANEPKTVKYLADEYLKKEDTSLASKSLLRRLQDFFCTIL